MGITKTNPNKREARPRNVKPMMSAAHQAMTAGFANTTCQLVSTAVLTLTCLSSSKGMATTLDANMGAANIAPTASHTSNNQLCGDRTTRCTKSAGEFTGPGAKRVISAADVSTQVVAAAASKRPKRNMHQ